MQAYKTKLNQARTQAKPVERSAGSPFLLLGLAGLGLLAAGLTISPKDKDKSQNLDIHLLKNRWTVLPDGRVTWSRTGEWQALRISINEEHTSARLLVRRDRTAFNGEGAFEVLFPIDDHWSGFYIEKDKIPSDKNGRFATIRRWRTPESMKHLLTEFLIENKIEEPSKLVSAVIEYLKANQDSILDVA